MNFPANCVTNITDRRGKTDEWVLFRFSCRHSSYDGCVTAIPLIVLQTQYSVSCSPRCHLDKGEITVGSSSVGGVWSRKDLREINDQGFYAQIVEGVNGKSYFVGLSPLTVNQAKEILRKEKLVDYGERYLEDREERRSMNA